MADNKDEQALSALRFALRNTDPHEVELVWASALSLAELNQADVADTILNCSIARNSRSSNTMIERRTRRTPPCAATQPPGAACILINTMIGARKLDVPEVQARLKQISETISSRACAVGAARRAGNGERQSHPEGLAGERRPRRRLIRSVGPVPGPGFHRFVFPQLLRGLRFDRTFRHAGCNLWRKPIRSSRRSGSLPDASSAMRARTTVPKCLTCRKTPA